MSRENVTHLVGRIADGLCDLLVEAVLDVALGCCLFEDTESLDEGLGHALSLASNVKVLEGPAGVGHARRERERESQFGHNSTKRGFHNALILHVGPAFTDQGRAKPG